MANLALAIFILAITIDRVGSRIDRAIRKEPERSIHIFGDLFMVIAIAAGVVFAFRKMMGES